MRLVEAALYKEGEHIAVNSANGMRADAVFKSYSSATGNIYCTIDLVPKCFYVAEVGVHESMHTEMQKRVKEFKKTNQ